MIQFGGKITKELSERYAKSPNWKNGKFENLVDTTMNINLQSIPKLLYKQFFKTKERFPKQNIPIIPFNEQSFLKKANSAKLIWYGHSVILMRINSKTILIDPMLGPDAAPIAPFASKRFSENTLKVIDSLPTIDLMLLTHDHYDHLDLSSIKKLIPKVNNFYVALGTARHLIRWGVDKEIITEFDWWDNSAFEDIQITFTPTRHFSGRGLTDRAKSIWGGWTFKTSDESIYFSGDGGYGNHFKEVGERLGPFDFGIMECGQYNENWHQIHLFPEESIQAAIDAKVSKAMPVHWAGFALAQHHWKEPVIRFVDEAEKLKMGILTPSIGEEFSYDTASLNDWWTNFD